MGLPMQRSVPTCNAEIEPDGHEAIQGGKSAKIRTLNDRFRKSLTGGRVMMTAAVSALPDKVRARAIKLTRTFDDFTPDNDPHNEHDFGSFEIDDLKFIFKHDYYDKSMQYGSEDPGSERSAEGYEIAGNLTSRSVPNLLSVFSIT